MSRKFKVEYSEVVYYEAVEVDAETEDEAQDIVENMVANKEVSISDTEFNDIQVEDLGDELE